MSQHDFDIANQGFAAFRADLNNALKALGSLSSGTAEPATTYANQLWYETDTNTLHIRNEANSAWLDLMVIDQTTGSPSFNAGNVGIGTSSPAEELHIQATAPTLRLQDSDDSAYTNFIHNAGGFRIDVDPTAAGASSFFRVDVDGSERIRIDSSGNVGIGTSSPTSLGTGITTLELKGNSASQTDRAGGINFMRYDGNPGMYIYHADDASYIDSRSTYPLLFYTNGTEAARIDSGGIFSVGCTSLSTTSTTDTGAQLGSSGAGNFFRSGNTPLNVMRQTNDGTLVDLRQGGTSEGTISVSGTTVSYNGGHLSRWAQFPDNSRPELLKGTVMSNLDQMSQWGDEDNEQLNCVQVSTVEGDPDVAGVFVAWDSTDDGYNDILLAMTGDMVIRIGAGVTVARGDLLMSAGDGTAKPQGDDIVRSKTIAKVTSTHVSHTYADGSYAVPCVLMAC